MTQNGPVEPSVLGARLRQQQTIDDPHYGELEPLALEARSALWPHAANWALIELIAVTESGARRLEEYRFTRAAVQAETEPPTAALVRVAVLFERTPNGASRARLYSTPTLRASHKRARHVDVHLAPGRDAADYLGRWLVAMQSGELETAASLFASDATLQEPDGTQRSGQTAIAAALARLPLRGGDALHLYTRLDAGARSALELRLPSENPALIVAERSARGALSSVRIYA
jgi:hypothetical protein